MSSIPNHLRYTKDHEWVLVEGNVATVGITDHAQSELGDIVFVSLPSPGDQARAGESVGTIEAVKTVAEVYSPLSGEVVEANQNLADSAAVINQDPYGQGWIVKIRIQNVAELDSLMDPAGYSNHIQ